MEESKTSLIINGRNEKVKMKPPKPRESDIGEGKARKGHFLGKIGKNRKKEREGEKKEERSGERKFCVWKEYADRRDIL